MFTLVHAINHKPAMIVTCITQRIIRPKQQGKVPIKQTDKGGLYCVLLEVEKVFLFCLSTGAAADGLRDRE